MNSPVSLTSWSSEKGPSIPTIVQISNKSVFNSADCIEMRKFYACSLMSTELITSVNALMPAITTHHQSGGAVDTVFVAELMYSNKAMHFINNHLQTFPVTSRRVGPIAGISAINPFYYHRCTINFFMISMISLSHNSKYA